MGLFADRCQALIDPKTGEALTGAALEEARKNPHWPRCGNRVPKAARNCSRCGSTAPGGWWKCPNCGKWVGNESRFCWNCKQRLHPESRDDINAEGWARKPGVFAQRFHVGDVQRILTGGLIVHTGEAAILLEGGRVETVLGPGRHMPDNTARKINWWGAPPPREFILVEAGDVVLPLRLEGLRSAEELPLELYTEAVLRFTERRAAAFVENLFKNADRLSYAELAGPMTGEIRLAAESLCAASTIEDLVKSPDRRLHLENAMATTLATALERHGLELIRLAAVCFTGAEYEKLREKVGALEVRRREIEFDQRLRELLATDKMQQFKTEADLEAYVRQLAQERDVSEAHRNHEMERLRLVHRHELEREEAAYQMAREMEAAAHEIGVKLQWDDYTRGKLVQDAETQARIKAVAVDAEVEESLKWLRVQSETMSAHLKYKAEKSRIELEAEAQRAAAFQGMDLQTLIAAIPDPSRREHLLRLDQQARAAGMTPEQLLAGVAAESPAAAAALADMGRVKREDFERLYRERREEGDAMMERLERILKAAVEAVGKAGHGGSTQQIFR